MYLTFTDFCLLASLFWSSNLSPLVCLCPICDIIVFPVSPGVARGIFQCAEVFLFLYLSISSYIALPSFIRSPSSRM